MSAKTIRLLSITEDSTDNGDGLRTVIYVAGCIHACRGCHNVESWRVSNGEETDIEDVINIIKGNPLADVTISGGDPLSVQYEETLDLLRSIKVRTDKNVWLYTGYTFEDIILDRPDVLPYIDVLVDGQYDADRRDLLGRFKGSDNQRIIDVSESLAQGTVILK